MERLVCMAQLGCVRRDETDDEDLSGLSYVALEVKEKLCGLPRLDGPTLWKFHLHESADLSCIWSG